jgi:hypothetical protein
MSESENVKFFLPQSSIDDGLPVAPCPESLEGVPVYETTKNIGIGSHLPEPEHLILHEEPVLVVMQPEIFGAENEFATKKMIVDLDEGHSGNDNTVASQTRIQPQTESKQPITVEPIIEPIFHHQANSY